MQYLVFQPIARLAICYVHVVTVGAGSNATCVFNLFNPSSPGQNDSCFTDDLFKSLSLNENVSILIKISLKFVSKGPIDNNPALV